jgi:hypothetical protein
LIEPGHGSTHVACILQRLLALRRERELASDKTSPACGLYRECATDPAPSGACPPGQAAFPAPKSERSKKNWFR